MKKFEQLQNAYLKSISEIEKYIRKCNKFIDNFIDNFTECLECKSNQIIYDS